MNTARCLRISFLFIAAPVLAVSLLLLGCSGGGGGASTGDSGNPAQDALYPVSAGSYTVPTIGDPTQYLDQVTIPSMRQEAGTDTYLGAGATQVYAEFDRQSAALRSALVSTATTILPSPELSPRVMRATGSASIPPTNVAGWSVSGDGSLTTDFGAGNSGEGLGINVTATKDGGNVTQNISFSTFAEKCPDSQGKVTGKSDSNFTMGASNAQANVRLSTKSTAPFVGHADHDGKVTDYDVDYQYTFELSGQQFNAASGTMVAVPTRVYRIRINRNGIPLGGSFENTFTNILNQGGLTGRGPSGSLDLNNVMDRKILESSVILFTLATVQIEDALKKVSNAGCGTWTGTSSVMLSNSAPVYKIMANVTWVQDTQQSSGNITVYHPEGTLALVPLLDCLSYTPANYTVTHADGELRIDSSTTPPTYTGSTTTQPWPVSLNYTCEPPSSYAGLAGGAWFQGSGSLTPDGNGITGSFTPAGGDVTFTYNFTRN